MGGADRQNPIIAGDDVRLSHTGDAYAIEELLPRRTLIARGSDKRRGKQHAIVANVDHALVVFAADRPRSRVAGIDRYLVACQYQHLDVTLVFNKWDLKDKASEALVSTYQSCGYRVITTRAQEEPEEARLIIGALDFKKLYVVGPSGVGKSSLLNATIPGSRAATGTVNESSGLGRQTTTHIELVPFGEDRFIADTPGLGHLTMLGIEPHNLRNLYPEMAALGKDCRFPDCLHINEPGCRVLEELESKVTKQRYESYLLFHQDLVHEAEKTLRRGKRS
jgi:ribosome biogenesis GTPase